MRKLATFWGNQFEKQSIEKRFWSKVDIRGPDECWLWLAGAYKHRGGYGRFRLPEGSQRAHRMAWILTNGPILSDVYVLHYCDNPPCVNPAHLWTGTTQENSYDRNIKGRQARGERNSGAKLSEGDVLSIRGRYRPRIVTMEALGSEFGISKQQVSDIINRKKWRHI